MPICPNLWDVSSKYLKHKTNLHRSPNSVRSIAYALSYYLTFLEKNYIDNPYEGWIENRLSGEKSSFLVENLSLRTSITVNMAEYPEEKEQKREDYRAVLAKTLLCKDSKQNGQVFVMSDCSTFKVYEIRELADRLYVLFSINFDSYDKPEVKAKLDELYEQLKKDNQ